MMLYKSNSSTNQMSEFEMCGLTVKVMVCICVLYYSIMALYAIESSYNINDSNDRLIVVLVCNTIIVSVGMILSYYCYRCRQTELRLAICLLFILSIFGLYGLLFSELHKSEMKHPINYEKDIHLISWIWINLISFSAFVLFVGIIGYIIYLQKDNMTSDSIEIQGTSSKKIANKKYLHSIFEHEHEL